MKRASKKYVLELPDLRAYVKLVTENKMSVHEVCRRLRISASTYYKKVRELADQDSLMERPEAPNETIRISINPKDLRTYEQLVAENRISVDEICRRLNIKKPTYLRKLRNLSKLDIKEENQEGLLFWD